MLPDLCGTCNTMYSNTAVAGLQCIRCDRVAHMECFNKDEATLRTTSMYNNDLIYMCNLCQKDIVKNKEIKEHMKTKKRQRKEGGKEKPVEPVPKPTENPFSDSGESSEEEDATDEAAEEWAKNQKKETLAGKNKTKKADAKENESTTETEKLEKKPLCIHFRNNRCKYGLKGEGCNFDHPKRCNKKWKGEADGCKNNNCKLFHGKLCIGSLKSKVCLKEKCTFLHSKDTRRTPMKASDLEEKQEKPQKNFKCAQCGKCFTTAVLLSEHIAEHSKASSQHT